MERQSQAEGKQRRVWGMVAQQRDEKHDGIQLRGEGVASRPWEQRALRRFRRAEERWGARGGAWPSSFVRARCYIRVPLASEETYHGP